LAVELVNHPSEYPNFLARKPLEPVCAGQEHCMIITSTSDRLDARKLLEERDAKFLTQRTEVGERRPLMAEFTTKASVTGYPQARGLVQAKQHYYESIKKNSNDPTTSD